MRVLRPAAQTLLTLVLFLPLLLAARSGLFHQLGNNPTLAFLLAGSFTIHLNTKPRRHELLVVLLGAIVLRIVYGAVGGVFEPYFGSSIIGFFPFLGLASISWLAALAICAKGDTRQARLFDLLAASVLVYFWLVLGFCLRLTVLYLPRTYDLLLYRFDSGFGFQPSSVAARLFLEHPILWNIHSLVYYALPFCVSMLYAYQRANPGRLAVDVFRLFVASSVVGLCLYFLYPACGPLPAFARSLPDAGQPAPETVLMAPLSRDAPRNAMPSLHFAAALLVFWNCFPWPLWARTLVGSFVALTALATLGLGEHYLVDLAVAFPFALGMQGVCADGLPVTAPARRKAVLTGSGLVLVWLVTLRFCDRTFPWPPVASWGAVAGTLGLTLALKRQLMKASATRAGIRQPELAGDRDTKAPGS